MAIEVCLFVPHVTLCSVGSHCTVLYGIVRIVPSCMVLCRVVSGRVALYWVVVLCGGVCHATLCLISVRCMQHTMSYVVTLPVHNCIVFIL